MNLEVILRQILPGISTGMLLFIVSSGLTLVFGVLRVINFAHGSLYMIGAYLAVLVGGFFAFSLGGFIAALIIVPILVALLGFVLEFFLFKRIYRKEHLLQLLLTYGLTLILADLVRIIWGGQPQSFTKPEILSGRVDILGQMIPKIDAFVIVVGFLIGAGLWFLLQQTRFGRIVRAAVKNPEMLSALGVNVDRVVTLAFMLGAWLAGFGGVLAAVKQSVDLETGSSIIVQAFAIVVIGGLGSFAGALIGSLLVGITLALGIVLPSALPEPYGGIFATIPTAALPFLAMALILILRPWGLLGKPER
jgi:branched-chain amino acid transport system permease protein